MSINKDASGRRWVQAEVELPGTPEEIWDAIATGPGVSSWFVPTEEREDGTVVSRFGPGIEAVAKKTAWDPPRRFAAESPGFGPDAPPLATEWIVEARSGGTCIVRVVHSLFASTDDWDTHLESIESGWPWFFHVLRLYVTHFRTQPCTAFRVMGMVPGPALEAWDALTGPLSLAGAAVGQRVSTPAGAPPLAGVVEQTGSGGHPQGLMLRLNEPAPGIASLFALAMGGQVYLILDFYLYGQGASSAAASAEPAWQAWMAERFPLAGATACDAP
jgi:uncharacterized protein YndB with AHSA1/START domain